MTPKDIILRPARPQDAAALAALAQALAAHHDYASPATVESIARDAFDEAPWLHLIVAEGAGGLVGYAALGRTANLPFGTRHAEIRDLFVTTGHRGRGIGSALVAACVELARGWSCATLTVGAHPDNARAQAFHTGRGFTRRDSHAPRFEMDLAPIPSPAHPPSHPARPGPSRSAGRRA